MTPVPLYSRKPFVSPSLALSLCLHQSPETILTVWTMMEAFPVFSLYRLNPSHMAFMKDRSSQSAHWMTMSALAVSSAMRAISLIEPVTTRRPSSSKAAFLLSWRERMDWKPKPPNQFADSRLGGVLNLQCRSLRHRCAGAGCRERFRPTSRNFVSPPSLHFRHNQINQVACSANEEDALNHCDSTIYVRCGSSGYGGR